MTRDMHFEARTLAPQREQSTVVRRWVRSLAVLPALVILAGAVPAFAEAPNSSFWEDPDNGSTLHALVILAGIPIVLFVGIWILAALPSMLGGQKYDSAIAFQSQPEWFGGPRRGTDAAPDDASEPQGRGGTSAHW